MTPNLEKTDEVFGSGVTASLLDTVRHVVFATAVALPMGLLSVTDSFEGDSEAASAGELWLEVQNKLTVATERMA